LVLGHTEPSRAKVVEVKILVILKVSHVKKPPHEDIYLETDFLAILPVRIPGRLMSTHV
jgi:hypothetical protein